MSDYFTLGWHREDGSFEVVATLNFETAHMVPTYVSRERVIDNIAQMLADYLDTDLTVLERQDAPSVIDVS